MFKILLFLLCICNTFADNEVFERIKNGTVVIKRMMGTESRHFFKNVGSGFIVDPKKGYVMTCAHVLAGWQERDKDDRTLAVGLFDGRTVKAKPVLMYYNRDVAIVQIIPNEYVKLPLPDDYSVSFRHSNDLGMGEDVFVLGNPMGMQRIMTSGIISSLGKRVMMPAPTLYENMIQTDAIVLGGNSGGGLFDSSGSVIGLVVISVKEKYGLAVPSALLMQVWDNFVNRRSIQAPMIGIAARSSSTKDDKRINYQSHMGVIVNKVLKGSPASKVLKAGDYIVSLNGERTYATSTLRALLHQEKVGSEHQITYFRNGKIKTSKIKTVNSYFDLRQEDIVISKQDTKMAKRKIKRKNMHIEIFKNLYGVPKIKRSITKKDRKNKVTKYQKKYRKTVMKMGNYI
jgi:S1-C subfamily serine protease